MKCFLLFTSLLLSTICFSQLIVPIGCEETDYTQSFSSNVVRMQRQLNGGMRQNVYFNVFDGGESDDYFTLDKSGYFKCDFCFYRFTSQTLYYKYIDYINLHLKDYNKYHIDKKFQAKQDIILSIFGYDVICSINAIQSPYRINFQKY